MAEQRITRVSTAAKRTFRGTCSHCNTALAVRYLEDHYERFWCESTRVWLSLANGVKKHKPDIHPLEEIASVIARSASEPAAKVPRVAPEIAEAIAAAKALKNVPPEKTLKQRTRPVVPQDWVYPYEDEDKAGSSASDCKAQDEEEISDPDQDYEFSVELPANAHELDEKHDGAAAPPTAADKEQKETETARPSPKRLRVSLLLCLLC